MAKLAVAVVVAVAVMLVMAEAKESLSPDNKVLRENIRSLSDMVRNAAARKQSSKRDDSCNGFGEDCWWYSTCCEGYECFGSSFTSTGTCFMKIDK